MKKMKFILILGFSTMLIAACGNEKSTVNTHVNETEQTSSTKESIEEQSVISIYDGSEKWALGSMNISDLIDASAGDQEKALSDANVVINLSLSKYFIIDSNKDKIELTAEGDNKDFFSVMFTSMSVPDKETMDILTKNFEELVTREPINPEINLYTLTALYSTGSETEDTTPVVISYQLSENNTVEKIE
ncbi:MAG TPA: hypothetical protein DEQ24_07365 [Enterococcus sp.]|nr:hypothetical protein [Enterococcus sp.]